VGSKRRWISTSPVNGYTLANGLPEQDDHRAANELCSPKRVSFLMKKEAVDKTIISDQLTINN
jgi:hypothetical protein